MERRTPETCEEIREEAEAVTTEFEQPDPPDPGNDTDGDDDGDIEAHERELLDLAADDAAARESELAEASAIEWLEAEGKRLTPRQLQIVKLIAIGKTNGEIARRLGLSIKTIDSHRSRIMRTLGTRNNVELARLAIKIGLVSRP